MLKSVSNLARATWQGIGERRIWTLRLSFIASENLLTLPHFLSCKKEENNRTCLIRTDQMMQRQVKQNSHKHAESSSTVLSCHYFPVY